MMFNDSDSLMLHNCAVTVCSCGQKQGVFYEGHKVYDQLRPLLIVNFASSPPMALETKLIQYHREGNMYTIC